MLIITLPRYADARFIAAMLMLPPCRHVAATSIAVAAAALFASAAAIAAGYAPYTLP